MTRLLLTLGVLAFANGFAAAADEQAKLDPAQIEFFEKNIRPIFVAHCVKCHGPEKQKGGFRLDTQAAMKAGGESGPAMVAGKPNESLLIKAVQFNGDIQMPPGKKLPDDQIAALATWVKMGAPWPGPTTETRPADAVRGMQVTDKDRQFWSFQPVKDAPLPTVQNQAWPKKPLDYFILAKLDEQKLKPVAAADKRTLVRRATFDLTGLPPTVEEMENAVSDSSPEWFAKVVDRLLTSPHYGERWARHWLDIARYGEDQAHTFAAKLFPYGFKYRDYVIKAFNDDLPYDRFLMEQIAGDLLEDGNREDRLAALGYFGLGPVYYGNAKLEELDDRIDTLCRGMLGLTVACARCHDHKFDPIPTKDYYSLAGVFASTQFKEYPVADPKTAAEFEKAQAVLKGRNDEINSFLRLEAERVTKSLTAEIGKYVVGAWKLHNGRKGGKNVPTADFAKKEKLHDFVLDRWVSYLFPKQADERAHLAPWREIIAKQDAAKDVSGDAEALKTVTEFATEFQDQLLALQNHAGPALDPVAAAALHREILGLNTVARQQVEKLLPADAQKQFAAKKAEVDKLTKALPKIPVLHALAEGTAQNMKVHLRGNPRNLGEDAPRGFLQVVAKDAKPFSKGSGRLELAQAIASKDNPLTARVMANRVWMYHFGKGIVGTPSNFGSLGERPTHPELLDHLASRFMAEGWSIKKLHREIMLSATYQLSSQFDADQHKVDGDNKYIWRMNRRRLEVESWRDAMLAVSGNLERSVGGPSADVANPENRRRTLYAMVSRHDLNSLLRLFDFPDPNATAEKRPITTVPLQQLFVLNSEFMARQAKALAAKLSAGAEDDAAKIRRAFQVVYGRDASEAEVALGQEFLSQTAPLPGEKPKAKTLTPWERYAQVLLGSNEFAFVD